MFEISNVGGTCIAAVFVLQNKKIFPKDASELYLQLVAYDGRIWIFSTRPGEDIFREVLVNMGATKLDLGDRNQVYILSPENMVAAKAEMIAKIRAAVIMGDELSKKEGREVNELRVGDHVIIRDETSWLYNWNDGKGMEITHVNPARRSFYGYTINGVSNMDSIHYGWPYASYRRIG